MKKKNYENKPFRTKTKIGSFAVCLVLIIPIVFFCVFSFVDTDKELSKDENRMLKQRPAFSVSALFDGDLTRDFDDYYSDQFPLRDFFVSVNLKVKKLLTQYGGKDDIVIVDGAGKDDFQGEEAANG